MRRRRRFKTFSVLLPPLPLPPETGFKVPGVSLMLPGTVPSLGVVPLMSAQIYNFHVCNKVAIRARYAAAG